MAARLIIHEAASNGFRNATAYDAYRPSYRPVVVETLLQHLDLSARGGSRIVDLAAGTGKFTEVLAAREEKYEIAAVEPLESMRQTLAQKGLEGVKVTEGSADEIDLEDGWADGFAVAQAFHWFANEKALKEIFRVLKPGGKLALIWNIEHYNDALTAEAATQWEQKLNELSLGLCTDAQPRYRDYKWHEVFDRQAQAKTLFFSTPLHIEKVPFIIRLTPDALWNRLGTLSHIASLTEEKKASLRAKFDEVLADAERVGVDGKEVDIHGYTCIAWTQRL